MDLRELLAKIPHRNSLVKGEVYLVGGAIRDYFLGIDSKDFDIVVKGSGIEFAKKLKKSIGGTLVILKKDEDEARLVISPDLWFDITGIKGRNIIEDLKKRDFTINSIAIPLHEKPFLLDPLEGIKDIKSKLIRAPSPSNLEDDPLRLLRAFRFSSTLEFRIDNKTFGWIKEKVDLIKNVASERVKTEFFLLLQGNEVSKNLNKMNKCKLLESIFPEIIPLKETSQIYIRKINLLTHSLLTVQKLEKILKKTPPELENYRKFFHKFFEDSTKRTLIYLGALFHDIGKPATIQIDENGKTHFYGHEKIGATICLKIAKRLRFSKKERELFKFIVRNHMHPHFLSNDSPTQRAIYRYVKKTGELAFPLLVLAYADASATPPGKGLEGHLTLAEKLKDYFLKEEEKPKKRLVTGMDLIAEGLEPGPIFKEILNEIEELEAEGKIKTREDALEVLGEIIKKRGTVK